mgnify:CR=1 FL=1
MTTLSNMIDEVIINLAGYTPLLQFRTSAMAKTVALEFSVPDNTLVFQSNTCPQVQVRGGIDCAPGKYEWDLRMDNADGSIYLGEGIVIIEANVSR